MAHAVQLTKGRIIAKGGILPAVGGAGDPIKKVDTFTALVNPPSATTLTKVTVAVTVTGARAGDMIIAQPPATLEDDLIPVGCEITADDTATLYIYNPSAGTIDGAELTWRFIWVDLT